MHIITDIILELTSELKLIEKDLNFKKFEGIAELEEQIKGRINELR